MQEKELQARQDMLPVIEEFISLDGEGPSAGELSYFVRFAGCNLRCSWCDTVYSWDEDAAIWDSVDAIAGRIENSGIANVTITGGEPLLQKNLPALLNRLAATGRITVRIETNGAVDIAPWRAACPFENIIYILDYKLPASGMEGSMDLRNLTQITRNDVYKFVIAGTEDLNRAVEIVKEYRLTEKCMVYFSPVREEIDPLEIVEAMKAGTLNGVRLQLQLHKILWPKDMRGV